MARSHSLLALACILTVPLALGGCAGVVVVGGLAAAAGSGYVIGQERGADGLASDLTIKTEIARAFIQADPQIQRDVTATVYNKRVLLTGRVANPAMKTAAAQIAGQNPNVRAVHDEIELASDSFWDEARDTWISTQVRSEMVVDADIRSVNYAIETENGSVYLMGSARSQRELDRATDIARRVPGVRRVVSYVEVRSGVPVAASPVGSTMGPATSPSAAPRTPIEVQKL